MNAIVGYMSGHTCGDACWHARDLVCVCSCGGKNHGILARGDAQPVRTARIGGQMYQLAEVGEHAQVKARCLHELRACGHHWLLDPNGPWITRAASQAQVAKWPELAGFQQGASLLWQTTTEPTP